MATVKKDNRILFTIQARAAIDVSVEVHASNLQEALDLANNMQLNDFLTHEGELLESKHLITGVFEAVPYIKL